MSAPGFRGNLSSDQNARLQQLWSLLLHLAEASSLGALEEFVRVNSIDNRSSLSSVPPPQSPRHSLSRRNSLFVRTESVLSRTRSRSSTKSIYHARLIQTFREAGFSSSELRNVRRFLAAMTPEDVRFGVLTAAKHEHPDVYLLRYLRGSKWDVNQALIQLLDSIAWRLKQMNVDNILLPRGELYAAEHENDTKRHNDSAGFIKQLRMGKAFVHGVDRLNRPVVVIRIRLHKLGEQSDEALNQFITHIIESARLLLSPPIETATVLFDMTGFSLANMEYAPVKFIIRCVETYYPESLGVLLIHNAPRVFGSVWKIIKPWISPEVVSRIHFTNTPTDLEQFIPRASILRELGGDEDWEYQYIEPSPTENEAMSDTSTRDSLLVERQTINEEFLSATSNWIETAKLGRPMDLSEAIAQREGVIQRVRFNYWELDPYVRARNILDRTGVISDGGWIDMYPNPDAVLSPLPSPVTPRSPASGPPAIIDTAKVLQVAPVQRAQVKIVNV
ncbi:CRAL-TRIO domain-containing protein [Aspergillus unguis]